MVHLIAFNLCGGVFVSFNLSVSLNAYDFGILEK